jgi:two-component system LytT family sensor kinase
MKKRTSLFSFAFLIFYGLAIVVRQLPELVRGRFPFDGRSHNAAGWVQLTGDVLIYYFLALAVYLLLCRHHPRKQYLYLFTGLLLVCTASFFCALLWTRLFQDVRMSRYFQLVIIPVSAQVFFSAVFYLIRYAQYKELQQLQLQLQNRQTELSLLRSQINPHFLFNHLNNIYSLVYEQNKLALPAISGLSELLRYMLYQGDQMVLLTTEISYLEKYIALQQLRFERPSMIEMTQTSSDQTFLIPPFLLIPFVENAFKHGQVSLNENWLKIQVSNDSDLLNFSCINVGGVNKKDITGGIGLNNVKQRLNLLYPDRHQLEITDINSQFVVKLQIHHGD